MSNVRSLSPRPVVNRLSEEPAHAEIHRVMKFALSGAVAAYRKSVQTKDEHEKMAREIELSAFISVVTEATTIHEAGSKIYDAIVTQRIHNVPALYAIATSIQQDDAA